MMYHKNQMRHQMQLLQLNRQQNKYKPIRIHQVAIQRIPYRVLISHRADHQLQKVSVCVGGGLKFISIYLVKKTHYLRIY